MERTERGRVNEVEEITVSTSVRRETRVIGRARRIDEVDRVYGK